MGLLALFAAMATPRIRNQMDLNLKKRARMISAAAQHMYYQAAFKNATYRLHFNLDEQTYWVEKTSSGVELQAAVEKNRSTLHARSEEVSEPKFTSDTSLIPKPIKLEKGLKFKDIQTESNPLGTSSGHAYIHFFSFGYAEKATIRITSERGQIYSVVISPLTGNAKVYPYDVSEKNS